MSRRLVSPGLAAVTSTTAPFWAGRGWTTRRESAAGNGGTDPEGGAEGGEDVDEDDDENENKGGSEDDEKVSKADLDKVMERMRAADRAKAAAEQKLREREDKDKSALELAETKVATLTDENTKLKNENSSLRMENAFANFNEISWVKPGSALKLAKADGYLDDVFNDDGSVDSRTFQRKVKEFAKAYPEFVKAGGQATPPPPPSGGGAGSGPKGKGPVVDDKALERKYGRLLR